jgi:hypothetical protein
MRAPVRTEEIEQSVDHFADLHGMAITQAKAAIASTRPGILIGVITTA